MRERKCGLFQPIYRTLGWGLFQPLSQLTARDIGECWDQKPLDTKHSHEVNNLVVFFNVISYIVMSQIPVAMFGCRLSLHITNINLYYCNETVEYDVGKRKWTSSGACSCFRESILQKRLDSY